MTFCIICGKVIKDICDECHDYIFENYKSAKDWDKEKELEK